MYPTHHAMALTPAHADALDPAATDMQQMGVLSCLSWHEHPEWVGYSRRFGDEANGLDHR